MKTLYLECYSGISGDMTVAALLDLGVEQQALETALKSLGVEGYHLHFGRTQKCGIDAFDFDVHLEEALHAHDPIHAHLHDHVHDHEHDHTHEHVHDHEHDHQHEHIHRNLGDIVALINGGDLTPRTKTLAIEIFKRVACAEAKVHGKPIDEVHFHEVGATDSIIDIVATAFCIDWLGIDQVLCSPLSEGQGTVRCAHGIMPVPAPATAEIVAESGLLLRITEQQGEMVTPTGAAIAAALSNGNRLPKGPFRVLKTGYGAGKKEFARANVLRAHLIVLEEKPAPEKEAICELSCNIDNMTGEHLGFAMERLFEAGAKDVWFTAIQMKKNRPGIQFNVLCMPEQVAELSMCMLRHTTSLGVRSQQMERTIMHRETDKIQTLQGEIAIKKAVLGELEKISVEYESARKTAIQEALPIGEIFRQTEKLL